MLDIPPDLFTPLFAVARITGWCAHRMEEVLTGGRLYRPAYKSLTRHREYIPMAARTYRKKSASRRKKGLTSHCRRAIICEQSEIPDGIYRMREWWNWQTR